MVESLASRDGARVGGMRASESRMEADAFSLSVVEISIVDASKTKGCAVDEATTQQSTGKVGENGVFEMLQTITSRQQNCFSSWTGRKVPR
jgi:hypothetical protein